MYSQNEGDSYRGAAVLSWQWGQWNVWQAEGASLALPGGHLAPPQVEGTPSAGVAELAAGCSQVGAHCQVPAVGALQVLPVTGREPDMERSPQTTPPRELLTPAGTRAASGGLAGGHPIWPPSFGLSDLSNPPGKDTRAFSSSSEGVEGTLV